MRIAGAEVDIPGSVDNIVEGFPVNYLGLHREPVIY